MPRNVLPHLLHEFPPALIAAARPAPAVLALACCGRTCCPGTLVLKRRPFSGWITLTGCAGTLSQKPDRHQITEERQALAATIAQAQVCPSVMCKLLGDVKKERSVSKDVTDYTGVMRTSVI